MPKISTSTVAEHKLHVRELLLDAVDSLLAERPFESISMRDVSVRAGVGRTVIYNYAPDTVTLLAEATKRGSAEVREAVASLAGDTSVPPSQRLHSIVTALLLDHASTTRNFLAAEAVERTLSPDRFAEAVEPFRGDIGGIVMEVVRAGVRDGEFADFADADLMLALMVGVMESAVRRVTDTPDDRVSVTEAAAQFLVNALSGRGAARSPRD